MKTSPNSVNNAPAANTAPARNLLEVAAAHGTFKTFTNAIESAGLSETLRGTGPFTVFAPTDTAFEQLPAGRLESLLKPENKPELISILNYHIVKGNKSVADVGKWTTARTINGQGAPIKLAGDMVQIDGAKLTSVDLASSNGMMHGIDKVNMPTPFAAPAASTEVPVAVIVAPVASATAPAPSTAQ
jgi:uncharacterized surface protein with fasciclin (FAS1) repeats